MTVRISLFTRDLRLADNPVPYAASAGGHDAAVPVLVTDPAVRASGFAAPNRLAFPHDCLADLDRGLRCRGSGHPPYTCRGSSRPASARNSATPRGWWRSTRRRPGSVPAATSDDGAHGDFSADAYHPAHP